VCVCVCVCVCLCVCVCVCLGWAVGGCRAARLRLGERGGLLLAGKQTGRCRRDGWTAFVRRSRAPQP